MLSTVQTPYSDFTGDGSTTDFSLGFVVYRAADLYVYFDDVLQSGYTVTDLGALTGATVTFADGDQPGSGVAVHIQASPLSTRDTEYQTNGDILASALNRDFDRLWNYIQARLLPQVITLTASHTLRATDIDSVLRFDSATDVVLTVNSDIIYPGFIFSIIQVGAGKISFAGTAYMKNVSGHTKTAGQHARIDFLCDVMGETVHEIVFSGDTAA